MARKRTKPLGELLPFHKRLQSLIGDSKQAEFAEKAGVSQSGLSGILAGGDTSLSTIIKLAKAGNVSPGWLFHDDDGNCDAGSVVYVKRLDFRASAGPGSAILSEDHGALAIPRHVLDRVGIKPERALTLLAEGNSMSPTIGDGDLLLIDRSDDGRRRPLASGSVFALTVDDEAFVKRIYREPGRLVLHSDSGAPDIRVDDSRTVRIIGRVVWVGHVL